jgi:hypothetical protein
MAEVMCQLSLARDRAVGYQRGHVILGKRMRNYDGGFLRGTIDSDEYGRLRDQNGNTYRMKPR